MILTTPVKNEFLSLECVASTIVEPGFPVEFEFRFTATTTVKIKQLQWEAPFPLRTEIPMLDIMEVLESGQEIIREITFFTVPGEEGFGEIYFTVLLEIEDSFDLEMNFPVWISVFERKKADREALDDKLRYRLVSVVNSRVRNGHIFLADYVSFFNDFLNIELEESIVRILAKDFGLPIEGLPVDYEKYIDIIRGIITFYGIKKLELIYEEECNQSDDKFDLDDMREVKLEEI